MHSRKCPLLAQSLHFSCYTTHFWSRFCNCSVHLWQFWIKDGQLIRLLFNKTPEISQYTECYFGAESLQSRCTKDWPYVVSLIAILNSTYSPFLSAYGCTPCKVKTAPNTIQSFTSFWPTVTSESVSNDQFVHTSPCFIHSSWLKTSSTSVRSNRCKRNCYFDSQFLDYVPDCSDEVRKN